MPTVLPASNQMDRGVSFNNKFRLIITCKDKQPLLNNCNIGQYEFTGLGGFMSTNIPVRISFHGVEHSDAIENRIREKIAKLEQFSDQISRCHVVVETPHKHMHKGKHYSIKIDLTVPGHEIVVNRDSSLDQSHEDIYVAIRDSFDEVKRRLQDHMRRAQGKVKLHKDVTGKTGPEETE
jgi:ribosomal subunit interface protein